MTEAGPPVLEFPEFTTTGQSASELVAEVERRSMKVSAYVRRLAGKDLIRTTEGQRRRLVGVRGSALGTGLIDMNAAHFFARRRGWAEARMEDALYLRLALSQADMERLGLWYVTVMHDLFPDTDEGELCVRRGGSGPGDLVETHPEGGGSFPAEDHNAYAFVSNL
jgi:hypothetical protein